jgi:hypothetical protein
MEMEDNGDGMGQIEGEDQQLHKSINQAADTGLHART